MAVDIDRGVAAGKRGRAIVAMLFDIPEVAQAFHLRANRRQALALDPETDEERKEIADALVRVADWLDDGFHEAIVAQLREIAAELSC
jgi:hypothetical protein